MEVLGEGSVVQREPGKPRGKCRKWELSVRVLEDGKVKLKTRQFRGAYREAQAALLEFVAELADYAPPSGWMFPDYARRWHRRREESGRYALKTMANEEIRIRAWCREWPGKRLEEVTWGLAEQTYSRWRGRYKNGTICIMHQTLDGILTEAVREGLIASNPVKGQKVPRFGRSESKALSDAQMDALAETLDPSDGRQLAALLCLTCGLRKGEALALRWSDWDGESIHVERADAGDGTDKPPKTPAGVRSIPVPSWLAPVLDSMAGNADEPICADMYGRRLGGNSFGSWWYHFRRTVGVDCTLHELRHSYLTRLARAGVHPRVMMRLAGHDSMRVCLEIYTHVSDDMQRDAVRNAFG